MKCWAHPKVDAVAVCVSCGKGLCKECSIVIAGNTYCKTCVESERWKAPPTPPPTAPPAPPSTRVPPTPVKVEPTPTPTGVPSKAQFVVGGIGSILNIIASIPMFFFAIALLIALPHYYEEYTSTTLAVGMIGYLLLMIGIIMAAIGYLGFSRNYGSGMGTASFVFAIIVTVLLIIIAIASAILINAGSPYYEYEYAVWWAIALVGQIIWFLLFGIMQILWGVTHIVTRKFTGNSGLSLATGIMLIIAGSLTTTFVITFVGMALFFVAEIMASVLFFISEVSTVSKL